MIVTKGIKFGALLKWTGHWTCYKKQDSFSKTYAAFLIFINSNSTSFGVL